MITEPPPSSSANSCMHHVQHWLCCWVTVSHLALLIGHCLSLSGCATCNGSQGALIMLRFAHCIVAPRPAIFCVDVMAILSWNQHRLLTTQRM